MLSREIDKYTNILVHVFITLFILLVYGLQVFGQMNFMKLENQNFSIKCKTFAKGHGKIK